MAALEDPKCPICGAELILTLKYTFTVRFPVQSVDLVEDSGERWLDFTGKDNPDGYPNWAYSMENRVHCKASFSHLNLSSSNPNTDWFGVSSVPVAFRLVPEHVPDPEVEEEVDELF